MRVRPTLDEVVDRHGVTCPRCRSDELVVVMNGDFDVLWECFDCETRWPASDEETALLLGSALKTIH
jgi:hypothetical protein